MYTEWRMEQKMDDLYEIDAKRSYGSRYDNTVVDLSRDDDAESAVTVLHFE